MTTVGLDEHVSDAQLWHAVRDGSVTAFEAVVHRYQSRVCAVAYSSCSDPALTEDIAQEAFWSAWRGRMSLADPDRLGPWLCGIARNLGHNANRRQARGTPTATLEAAANIPSPALGPAETVVSREEAALIWQTLQQIPEHYREPLILYYREDQAVAEVAAALDLTVDAVKQRLARGRQLLKEQVAGVVERTLRHSRPGRAFTTAVMAGLATLSLECGTVLAGTTAAKVYAPLANVAGTGLVGGLVVAVLGSVAGLAGGWLGTWLPAQVAPTQAERVALTRIGRRMFCVTLLLTLALFVVTFTLPGRVPLASYLACLGLWFMMFFAYVAVETLLAVRASRRLQADQVNPVPNDTPLRRRLDSVLCRYRGRVFRSRLRFLGIPLVDVAVSDRDSAGPRRVARGWIAVGDDAYGVLFACGSRAYGLVALGGVAMGLVAIGGIAVGGLALGGIAIGVVALGGAAVAWCACGGVALGTALACGGLALAWHAAYGGLAVANEFAVGGAALSSQANTALAQARLASEPLKMACDQVGWHVWWFPIAVVLGIVALIAAMYQRKPAP